MIDLEDLRHQGRLRIRATVRLRMALQLTAVIQRAREGYIGFVEELPGAYTQGATLAEIRENLQEAISMVLEANRNDCRLFRQVDATRST